MFYSRIGRERERVKNCFVAICVSDFFAGLGGEGVERRGVTWSVETHAILRI